MKSKDIVRQWFANIDNGDFEGIRKMMSNEHRFQNPMTPAPIGPDEHIGMMQMMTGAFAGEHHFDRIVHEGEWVAACGRWKGKHTGEFQGVPATGKAVEFTWADFFEIVDGQVRKEYFEMNPMTMMAQIGAVEN